MFINMFATIQSLVAFKSNAVFNPTTLILVCMLWFTDEPCIEQLMLPPHRLLQRRCLVAFRRFQNKPSTDEPLLVTEIEQAALSSTFADICACNQQWHTPKMIDNVNMIILLIAGRWLFGNDYIRQFLNIYCNAIRLVLKSLSLHLEILHYNWCANYGRKAWILFSMCEIVEGEVPIISTVKNYNWGGN